ncbi:MFS transporter [Gordonibacter pamelaeae]|uniref:MFS transporter n=1 Tax=Gordonibacter pamelaeae TaxID=471189 RepID=UPI003A8DA7A4
MAIKGTRNPLVLKAVILAVALQETGGGAVAPVISTIISENPQYAAATVMLISTMPFLSIALTSAFYEHIERHFEKRALTLFSIALFCLAGITPCMLGDNIPLIIAMRFCFGIAVGCLVPMVMSLINSFYKGKERASMLGLVQTSGSIGGVAFQTIGGYLGAADWHYCFLAYFISLAVLAFAFFALPNPPATAARDEAGTGDDASSEKRYLAPTGKQPRLPLGIVASYLCLFVYMTCIITFVNNISIIVSESGYGGAEVAGLCLSAHTVTGMLAGVLYGPLFGKLRTFTLPITTLVGALSLMIIYSSNSLTAIFAGSGLLGISAAATLAGFFNSFSMREQGGSSRYTSLGVTVQFLGQFLGSFIIEIILSRTGGSFGHDAFLVASIACMVAFAGISLLSVAEKGRVEAECRLTTEGTK